MSLCNAQRCKKKNVYESEIVSILTSKLKIHTDKITLIYVEYRLNTIVCSYHVPIYKSAILNRLVECQWINRVSSWEFILTMKENTDIGRTKVWGNYIRCIIIIHIANCYISWSTTSCVSNLSAKCATA